MRSGRRSGICGRRRATFVSRDPAVVGIDGASAYSAGNGTTWIVAELDGVQDSIPVRVRQRAASIECSPASSLLMPVQDSVQLSVAAWRDAKGHLLDEAPTLVRWKALSLRSFYAPGESLEITPAGMVHSNKWDNVMVVGVDWRSRDGLDVGEAQYCSVESRSGLVVP
jgi:hypothetical protein